ncbi:MAG: PAS domain-containing sensor histidine kinase, partial [Muribaculaceae bacterium]|nr:PAS domain-containing sensor histidine kinase [Muribaculaceae bacterium]
LRASGRTLLFIDNGPGLAIFVTDNLFSALYTTKPDGQGLGLLLVAEILNKHSARFSLSTTPPLTTFAITL